MAIYNRNLSKTHESPAVTILFVHDGVSNAAGRTERHTHDFWQLEIGVSGVIGVWDSGVSGTLLRGHALLLAPGRMHAFSYPDSAVRWVTYKFESPWTYDEDARWTIDTGHLLAPVISALAQLAPEVDRGGAVETATASSLLEAVTRYTTDAGMDNVGEAAAASSTFLARIDAVLHEAAGRHVGLEELASALHLSAGHVSNRFRTETGRALKPYMDETRFSQIEKLLSHSDLPIKLIAHQTGFPDMYAFSRFVKRMTGVPPRSFRRGAPDV